MADPWLETYKQKDKIGNTLVVSNTELGKALIKELRESAKRITLVSSSYDEYAIAQRPNIEKSLRVFRQRKYLDFVRALMSNRLYYQWATKSIGNMRIHIKLSGRLRLFLTKHDYPAMIEKYINKITNHFWSNIYRSRLGEVGNHFHVTGKIELNNPQCVSIGNNVGIGKGTFLGPVIQYAGIQYSPQIIIGDGTWVGKNCSIAAISKVEIGKHVLFAGHVHITDHSHGYEDISLPISPQRLLCKGPIIIEDNCWLGFSCEILSGVHIGKHSVVAARSVVTKDVPSYSIVAGNPARIVKQYNFETNQWERTKK